MSVLGYPQPDHVGQIVHVGNRGVPCVPGLVLAVGRLSLVRVSRPATRGGPTWINDEEGDVRHWTDAVHVDNPDGSVRFLDSWHHVDSCGLVAYPDLGPPVTDWTPNADVYQDRGDHDDHGHDRPPVTDWTP